MPATQHERQEIKPVRCAVLCISDTRTLETDKSGRSIVESLEKAGHAAAIYEILPDEPTRIESRLIELIASPDCQAVLLTGGTGIAARDGTYEVVARLLDKVLDGFGELFRQLSYAEIGPAAMLSRACAGVAGQTLIFSMPGSTPAVRLAMEQLILPELGHMAWLIFQPQSGQQESV
jgi:molybdenum cofactor biosynthesis protein B